MHHELPAAANSKLEHLEGVREAVWSPPAREQFGVGEGLENAVADGSAPDGTERRCRSLFFGFVTYPSITLWIAILLTAAAATPNDFGFSRGRRLHELAGGWGRARGAAARPTDADLSSAEGGDRRLQALVRRHLAVGVDCEAFAWVVGA